MRFNDYKPVYDILDLPLGDCSADRFYKGGLQAAMSPLGGEVIEGYGAQNSVTLLGQEMIWHKMVRPYYKVWPAFVDSLLKTKLDFPLSALPKKIMSVAVRFAFGAEPRGNDLRLSSFLMFEYADDTQRAICIIAQFRLPDGIVSPAQPATVGSQWSATIEDGLAETLRDDPVPTGMHGIPASLFHAAFKVGLSIIMLSDDPDFVEVEVLKADQLRYNETKNPKHIEKAKRNGIVGWNVGRQFESIPHLRRPHFGIRWTEKGRTTPKLVSIKGAVVHRQAISKVPTGYILPDGQEVEP